MDAGQADAGAYPLQGLIKKSRRAHARCTSPQIETFRHYLSTMSEHETKPSHEPYSVEEKKELEGITPEFETATEMDLHSTFEEEMQSWGMGKEETLQPENIPDPDKKAAAELHELHQQLQALVKEEATAADEYRALQRDHPETHLPDFHAARTRLFDIKESLIPIYREAEGVNKNRAAEIVRHAIGLLSLRIFFWKEDHARLKAYLEKQKE